MHRWFKGRHIRQCEKTVPSHARSAVCFKTLSKRLRTVNPKEHPGKLWTVRTSGRDHTRFSNVRLLDKKRFLWLKKRGRCRGFYCLVVDQPRRTLRVIDEQVRVMVPCLVFHRKVLKLHWFVFEAVAQRLTSDAERHRWNEQPVRAVRSNWQPNSLMITHRRLHCTRLRISASRFCL